MRDPVVVAVAHGSADPRASATIAELAEVARERAPGLDLRTAFLGHAAPSLPQVLGTIEADREVTVLPLLLTVPRAALVLVLTVLMCAASGVLTVRKLRSADPADLF